MKKIVSLLLCMVILAGILPVMGAETESADMQKILLSVKERIPDTKEYPNFTSNIRQSGGNTVYTFEWSSDNESGYRYMSVNVTASGIITNFSCYSERKADDGMPRITNSEKSDFAENAKNLADKLNPSLKDKLIIYNDSEFESLYATEMTFRLQRVENGLPVYGNTGSITIDSTGEKLLNYHLSYTENVTFPSPSSAISKEAAMKAFTEKLGLKLEYYTSRDGNKTIIYPAYTEKDTAKYINALTGEVFSPKYDDVVFRNEASMDKAMGSAGGGSSPQLSEAEISELEKISGLLSKEEIISLIEKNELIAPDKDMTLNSYSINQDYRDKNVYYAYVSYRFSGEGAYKNANYTLDAATGELKSFNSYAEKPSDTELKEISEEAAEKLMAEGVTALAGEKLKEYKKEEEENKFSEHYVRYVNGIPFRADSIHISVDAFTGKLNSFSIGYSKEEFPSVSEAISPSEAAEKLFSQVEYKLCYILDKNGATPVYIFDDNISRRINPLSGKLLSWNHEEFKENKPNEYTDISGHYAEEIIKTLSAYGIGFEASEFKPSESITQEDFVVLLTSAFINRGPIVIGAKTLYDDYYRLARRHSIIDESEIDKKAPVSRELAARFIISALNLDEYAKMDEIFNCPFNDVDKYKGYITLLYGLKVIKGDGTGKFHPEAQLTRADAAIMLYNYLTR